VEHHGLVKALREEEALQDLHRDEVSLVGFRRGDDHAAAGLGAALRVEEVFGVRIILPLLSSAFPDAVALAS